jgi:hypothetical protein
VDPTHEPKDRELPRYLSFSRRPEFVKSLPHRTAGGLGRSENCLRYLNGEISAMCHTSTPKEVFMCKKTKDGSYVTRLSQM